MAKNTAELDLHAVTELVLYTENDEYLITRRVPEFARNLAKKMARCQYDETKAVKLLEYLTKEAATKYRKEFGGPLFPPAVRRAAAVELLPSVVAAAKDFLFM